MANENNISPFSYSDIEKYHRNQLTPAQRNALEKAALEDPFLADALEGYAMPGVDAAADLARLKEQLAGRLEEKKVIPITGGAGYKWLRIAAVFVFIAAGAVFFYKFSAKKQNDIASADIKTQTSTPGDSSKSNTSGTTALLRDTVIITSSTPAKTSTPIVPSKTADKSIKEPAPAKVDDQISGNGGGTVVNTNVAAAEDRKAEEARDLAKKDEKDKQKETVTGAPVASRSNNMPDNSKNFTPVIASNDNRNSPNGAQNKPAAWKKDAGDFGITSLDSVSNKYYNNRRNNFLTFRGRITDANNMGLPFARVTNVDDNNAGTYTDAQGYFNLTYPDSVMNLQIRSVGFTNTNVQLNNPNAFNRVVLQEDHSLTETVLNNKRANSLPRQQNNISRELEEPEPADGWDNYDTYLTNNLNMPDDYRGRRSNAGEVEVSFEVDTYGNPVNIKVEKSLCKTCDLEAIRLIKEGPKWKQHTKNGRTRVTIPFSNNP